MITNPSFFALLTAAVLAASPARGLAEEPGPAELLPPAAPDRPAQPAPSADPPGEIIVIEVAPAETPVAASPVVTEVIDRRRMVETGAATVSAALAARPGLWLERGRGGTGISIQGLGPRYVLILVDGQRQIGRVDGAIDLDRFATGDLEQIEIVRGPGSARYGSDALGGVVNIVTRAPDQARAELVVQVDHRRATDLRASAAGGHRRATAAAAVEWRRGPALDRTPEAAGTTIAGYDDARGTLRGQYRRGERWTLDASADLQRRDLQGVEATATGAVSDRRNLIETASATGRARWLGERTGFEARAGLGHHRDQYASDQRGGSALDRYHDTRDQLVETSAQAERWLTDRHRSSAGGEVLLEALASARLREPGDRVRAALWLQHEWRAGASHRLLLVPAVRLDADSQFGRHVTPHVAARWDPIDDVVLRASVGMGYRAPSFKELLLRFENPGAGYVVEGNPGLRPETSTSVQAGGEWRAHGSLWLAAHVFGNDLHDLIDTMAIEDGASSGPIRFGYRNTGRARTAGAELGMTVGHGRLAMELGWAYTRARDLDTGRALEGVPTQRAAAALRWRDDDEGLTGFAELAATGARPYQLGATRVATDRRLDVRARIARRFGTSLELFMGVDNLLDGGDDRLDPIAPRTFHAGAAARR